MTDSACVGGLHSAFYVGLLVFSSPPFNWICTGISSVPFVVDSLNTVSLRATAHCSIYLWKQHRTNNPECVTSYQPFTILFFLLTLVLFDIAAIIHVCVCVYQCCILHRVALLGKVF
jgi:hypothetical protein